MAVSLWQFLYGSTVSTVVLYGSFSAVEISMREASTLDDEFSAAVADLGGVSQRSEASQAKYCTVPPQ
jgi:hypothetical protein